MNVKYSLLFAPILSLLSSVASFSMENEETLEISAKILKQPIERIKFVKSFVPKNSSEEYIEAVANCYRDALEFKKDIEHDRVLKTNTVTYDYGWTFPPVPRVQKHLLEFCANAEKPVNMMDIGAGYGLDSLFSLLTKNIKNLYALEKQKVQTELLKQVVIGSIKTNVDSNFPLKAFQAFNKDFLTLAPDFSKGGFDVLNANKVVHFFDIDQTKTFGERSGTLLKKGGRLFLTCLTPTPESKIENFMNSQEDSEFPGYVYYQQETMLIDDNIPGDSQIFEVRQPTSNEKSAHFFQKTYKKRVVTERVIHYHTIKTLAKMLGDNFDILETMITTPEENNGPDHMISIVAQKK